jgi:hypothetical protein
MTCDYYDAMRKKKTIQGKYKCEGKLENPAGEGSNKGDNGDNNGPKGAASSLSAVNGALGLAAMAAVLLF